MRGAVKCFLGAAAVCLAPTLAMAQGTLAGTVRDASGAILPGVTVTASSDALIEKARSAVTDGSGQYRIVDLQPGLYALTFRLQGFQTVARDGVEVSGSATVTIPAEMRVGSLQETVTVTAETPVIDVQNARREVVLQSEFIQALPATRNYSALLQMIPAINVGILISAETTPEMQLFTARGGNPNEGRITIDGMTVAAPFNGGGVSSFVYNTSDVTEVQVQVSGGLGESETGGPRMNIIPRSGGNTFSGQAFISTAGEWSRSENIDDELRAVGITRGPALKGQYDWSGSYGGPVKRDRLWFYGTIRQYSSGRVEETGITGNLNAGNRNASDPNSWLFRLDTSVEEVRNIQSREIYSGRLTGQLARHRLSFSREHQYRCDGSSLRAETSDGCRQRPGNWTGLGGTTTSPEADAGYFPQPYYTTQATWTLPKTNRLLLEAGFSRLSYEPVFGRPAPDSIFDMIPVTERFATDAATGAVFAPRNNVTYRAIDDWIYGNARNNNIRASATYVTGSHNMKVGYQGAIQLSDQTTFINTNPGAFEYRFNRGRPDQFTVNLPDWNTAGRTVQHSAYAQDSWSHKRLTLQAAVRYDHAYSWSPVEGNGTTKTSPWNAQPFSFDRTVSVRGYDDVTARFGVAYDLFGTGKTALKLNLGKYLDAATNDSNYTVNNPANRIRRTLTRDWTDNDADLVVDCDVLQPLAQGPTNANPGLRTVDTCAALTGDNRLFGSATPTSIINPAVLGGWGVRPFDWQFGVAVQQEVLPRVSVEVAYNRRWWGNFTLTDNRARTPDMYATWDLVAPTDPRLPGGGGYTITNYAVRPEFVGIPTDNYVTFESDFGERINYWHGVEVTGSARTRWGLTFQGGTSTGREVTDRCSFAMTIDSPNPRNCKTDPPFQTSFRGSATYTVLPDRAWGDVLVSTIVRLSPAPGLAATYPVPNTVVRSILGFIPNNGLTTGEQNVALLDNEHRLYADRAHRQVDMRFARILRFGANRADLAIDLYNIFNVNTPTAYEGDYDAPPAVNGGLWLQPTGIVQPRFARFNVTVNF